MKTSGTLWPYVKRYVATFFRKFTEFIGAQIVVGAVIAGLILWEQIRRHIILVGSTKDNILAVLEPYCLVIAVYLVWHLARTAYLLHLEEFVQIERLRQHIESTGKAVEVIVPSPPDTIGAKFMRQHFVNRNPYDELNQQALELMHLASLATAHDLLCEIHLVNRETESVTIQRIEAQADVNGHVLAMTPSDLDNYQLAFNEEEKFAHSPLKTLFQKREDLPNLWDKIRGTELKRGVGYQGWVSFGLMATPDELKEKVIFQVTLIDSLEGRHPVLLTEKIAQAGEVAHKIKK
jgi:hypothetical protein